MTVTMASTRKASSRMANAGVDTGANTLGVGATPAMTMRLIRRTLSLLRAVPTRRRRWTSASLSVFSKNTTSAAPKQEMSQLFGVDHFLVDQQLGQRLHRAAMGGQRLPHARVGRAQDPGDLDVDRLGRRLAVFPCGRATRLEERLARLLERREAELLAHAVLRDHVTGHVRRAAQVVRRAGRDIAEDDFLGHAAAEQYVEAVEKLGARHEIAILGRLLLRVAECGHPPRDDRDLVYGVGTGPELRDAGV